TSTKKPRKSALDRYGLDLTTLARENKFAPLIGRHIELERILTVLGCRSQKNPLLVGKPGAGKRAIIRGLAQRYAHDLSRKGRLVALSLDQMITATKSFDHFRAALTVILNDVGQAEDTLLFLENLAMLTASHKAEAFYAISWLRSALS